MSQENRNSLTRNCLWILLAVVWVVILSCKLGPLPPLGNLFEIHSGVWHHKEFVWKNHKVAGLSAPVQIAVDSSGIPHIFAKSETDLYIAQGYIMAAHRLFQMDLSSRATAGRLSELVGPKGLDMDRFFVRFGMRQSIMRTVNEYMSVPQTADMINAFVTGINSYIRNMQDLPVEYKLLRTRPELFDPSRVVAMARALTYNLSGYSDDLALSHLRQQIGVAKVLDLFPEFFPPQLSDYVLPGKWGPERTPEKLSDFKYEARSKDFPAIPRPAPGNGSNNWVVGPSKSSTGHSLLANDTHLGYSLPNIWFENQLTCPEFNVYGVSLIDVPGIINGFNPHTAWGPTNGTTDALDYYEVQFNDDTSLKYKDGESEKEAQVFNETIEQKNGPSELIPVIWTKWGPVLHREGRVGLVANWTGYQTSNELLALRNLYDTKTSKECLSAFRTWNVPLQNFVCADPDHIGILHAGFVPKRDVGEGRFISEAGSSRWNLTAPVGEKLRLERVDPKEGYLLSANQRVVDSSYDNYMGAHYESPFRGLRIRELLQSKAKIAPEDMIAFQNDDLDPQARLALPILLKVIAREDLSPEQRHWLEKLDHWDYHDLTGSVEPSLYKSWFLQLKQEIFSDEWDLTEHKNFVPQDMRVIWMLDRVAKNPQDPDSEWIDDKRTPEKETLAQIVGRAFKKSWSELSQQFGKDPAQWIWSQYNKTQIPHVAHLPGFGSEVLEMSGAGESVRGNRGWHGPVYKFVIALGDQPQAWMQVPGGNSGDPFSLNYGRNVREWAKGEMRSVEYYKDWSEAEKRATVTAVFTPEK